ncbi:transcriptional regulator [Oribacterium sp. C9]|nr:transcriptional regulator [Oribacterium sp. C9]
MNAYERYCEIRDSLGFKDSDVVKKTGIGKSTFSDWKSGRYVPKDEKMQKIAEALGTTADFIRYGVESPVDDCNAYYVNEETAKAAQEIFENKDLRILFDAARDAKPEDLKMAAEMLRRFKETNPDG